MVNWIKCSRSNQSTKMWRVFDQPIGTFVYVFVRYENFALYHNKKKKLLRADPLCRFVIKEFVQALAVRISSYGCTREVWRARKMRKSCTRR